MCLSNLPGLRFRGRATIDADERIGNHENRDTRNPKKWYPDNFAVPPVPISSPSHDGRGAFDGNLLGNGEVASSDVGVDYEFSYFLAGLTFRDIRQDLMEVLDLCFTPRLSNDASILVEASEFEVACEGGQPDKGRS